jgi:hypothetical protein
MCSVVPPVVDRVLTPEPSRVSVGLRCSLTAFVVVDLNGVPRWVVDDRLVVWDEDFFLCRRGGDEALVCVFAQR